MGIKNKNKPLDNLTEDEKTIWDASKRIKLPKPIDSVVSWVRLESKLNTDEEKQSAINILKVRPNLVQLRPVLAVSSIILLLVILPILYLQLNLVHISTERSEILSHTLPDGSLAQLNAESALKYKKSGWKSKRNMEIDGEVYFNAEKGQIPFVVNSDNITVTVLGTQFNIKHRNNIVEVAVNKGKVQVAHKVQDKYVTLSAGQMSRFMDEEPPNKPEALPFANYPSWMGNKLMVYQENLLNVCREIERRFNVQVQISNQEIIDVTVTGVLETDSIESVLSTLAILTQRQYHFEDGIYVIY
jgi:ferric-dicitrate binding protein FerR (iron transport regulator)